MIPTEPIGSLPRTPELLEAVERSDSEDPALDALCMKPRFATRSSDSRRPARR